MILMGVGTWLMLQRQPGSPDAVKEENARRNGKSSVSGVDRPSTPAIEYSSTEDSNRTEWAQWLSDGMKLLARPGMWLFFAFGSAFFAAITAILGKIGIENVDSNLGTAIRTIVVFLMAWQLVLVTGRQKEIKSIHWKSWCFIVLSGCATGASWLCYYRALQGGPASAVAPVDKLSVLVTAALLLVLLPAGQGVLFVGLITIGLGCAPIYPSVADNGGGNPPKAMSEDQIKQIKDPIERLHARAERASRNRRK